MSVLPKIGDVFSIVSASDEGAFLDHRRVIRNSHGAPTPHVAIISNALCLGEPLPYDINEFLIRILLPCGTNGWIRIVTKPPTFLSFYVKDNEFIRHT